MILAIPVQGVAAATMLYCGTEHHHSMTGEHDGEDEHPHSAAVTSTDHMHTDVAAVKHIKGQCSSCAACCVGAAMVTEPLTQNILSSSPEKTFQVFSSPLGHISDGLERPPRA